ncbi:MAG: 50S ribosomal protein L4 [bacterium]|nr:50S ribosomal protein L4 [bacterium]
MANVKVYNVKGEVVGDLELDPKIFEVAAKKTVIHQVMVAQGANSRQVVAHTKTRGEVQGGGKKPWKQKGTGRARHGSIRSPLWKGGGVTFGPRKDRNYTKQVNKKMKLVALRMVLSDKVAHDHLIIVDSFDMPEMKTKQMKEALSKLPSANEKNLVALGARQEAVIRSAMNLPKVNCIAADSLNVVDLLKYDYLVIDQAGVEKVQQVFGVHDKKIVEKAKA